MILFDLFRFEGYKKKYKNLSKDIMECLEQNETLVSENLALRSELDKKQEQINKTNSYWKGVVRDLKSKKPVKRKKDLDL
jgi:regulator of replication initiation timing